MTIFYIVINIHMGIDITVAHDYVAISVIE